MTWGYDKPDRQERFNLWRNLRDEIAAKQAQQVQDGPLSFGELDEAFAEQAARTVKGSRTSQEASSRPEDVLDETRYAPEQDKSVKRFLKACANSADWTSARKATAKIEDILSDEFDSWSPTPEQAEHISRIIARVVARARTRGARDVLESLDMDTDALYDEVEDV